MENQVGIAAKSDKLWNGTEKPVISVKEEETPMQSVLILIILSTPSKKQIAENFLQTKQSSQRDSKGGLAYY